MKFSAIGLRVAIIGLLAGSYELVKAKAPYSPGGTEVMPEEYLGIFAALGDSVQGENKRVDFGVLADKLSAAKTEDSPGGVDVVPAEIVGILAEAGGDWVKLGGGVEPCLALDELVAAYEASGWTVMPSGWREV